MVCDDALKLPHCAPPRSPVQTGTGGGATSCAELAWVAVDDGAGAVVLALDRAILGVDIGVDAARDHRAVDHVPADRGHDLVSLASRRLTILSKPMAGIDRRIGERVVGNAMPSRRTALHRELCTSTTSRVSDQCDPRCSRLPHGHSTRHLRLHFITSRSGRLP